MIVLKLMHEVLVVLLKQMSQTFNIKLIHTFLEIEISLVER